MHTDTIIKNTFRLFHRPKCSTAIAPLWRKRTSHHISHLLIRRPLLGRRWCRSRASRKSLGAQMQRNIIHPGTTSYSRDRAVKCKLYSMLTHWCVAAVWPQSMDLITHQEGIKSITSSCIYHLTLKDLINAALSTANNSTHASKTLGELLSLCKGKKYLEFRFGIWKVVTAAVSVGSVEMFFWGFFLV